MRAKTVNESADSAQSVLLKQREKLMAQLEKAKEQDEKAEAKKATFIEKYSEKAWWANIDNYDGHMGGYYNKNGRYPGFAVWNGEGPIMRAINNAANKIYRTEDEIKEVDKKLSQVDEKTPVKSYYGEWETAGSKSEDYMMDQLSGIISEFVTKVGYGGDIKDPSSPAFGKSLRDTSIEELTNDFFDTYGDQLSKEQIEEIATDVYNLYYLDGYKDDDGKWIFPDKKR